MLFKQRRRNLRGGSGRQGGLEAFQKLIEDENVGRVAAGEEPIAWPEGLTASVFQRKYNNTKLPRGTVGGSGVSAPSDDAYQLAGQAEQQQQQQQGSMPEHPPNSQQQQPSTSRRQRGWSVSGHHQQAGNAEPGEAGKSAADEAMRQLSLCKTACKDLMDRWMGISAKWPFVQALLHFEFPDGDSLTDARWDACSRLLHACMRASQCANVGITIAC